MIDVAIESENENASRDPVAFELGSVFGERLACKHPVKPRMITILYQARLEALDNKMDWTPAALDAACHRKIFASR